MANQKQYGLSGIARLFIICSYCYIRQDQYKLLYLAVLDYYTTRKSSADKCLVNGVVWNVPQTKLKAEYEVTF